MSDLPARLRAEAQAADRYSAETFYEAAGEIERMEARLTDLERAVKQVRTMAEKVIEKEKTMREWGSAPHTPVVIANHILQALPEEIA